MTATSRARRQDAAIRAHARAGDRYIREYCAAQYGTPEPTMLGFKIHCPDCDAQRKVTEVHPANMRHPDPTEWYTLECGHSTI